MCSLKSPQPQVDESTTIYKYLYLILTILYSDFTVIRNDTQFSYRKILYWKEISRTAQGNYTCIAFNQSTTNSQSWFFNVITEPRNLHINSSQLEDEKFKWRDLGRTLRLTCSSSGYPWPIINWYRGDELILRSDRRVRLLENDAILEISKYEAKDEAIYRCVASNKMWNDSQEFVLNFTKKTGMIKININILW